MRLFQDSDTLTENKIYTIEIVLEEFLPLDVNERFQKQMC